MYEHVDEVKKLETEIKTDWEELSGLILRKQEVSHAHEVSHTVSDLTSYVQWADDDLARERYAEDWRLRADSHEEQWKLICTWYNAKAAYLTTKEDVQSVYEAKYQLGRLNAFDAETMDMTSGAVATMKECGKEILAARFKTDLSEWVYEDPSAVNDREADVDKKWAELTALCQVKREILADDLAREVGFCTHMWEQCANKRHH